MQAYLSTPQPLYSLFWFCYFVLTYDFILCVARIQYGTVPPLTKLKPAPAIYPASVLATFNTMERQRHIDWATQQSRLTNQSGTLGTYLPLVMTGWDAMPWGGEGRPRFSAYSADEWLAQLRSVQSQMAVPGAASGFPLPGGGVQPAFSMYCWNEFGEGGMLAPTEGLGSSRLEAIKQVFGVAAQ